MRCVKYTGYILWKLLVIGGSLLCLMSSSAVAVTEDLGNGFFDHGVATPVSNHRGTVATRDGQGRDVVLVWLFDHRGGYALLMIDAQTGKSRQFPTPFPPGGDCPYASILSSHNRYYTHFNSYFCEFDPAKPGFTFFHKTAPQMAMSMTEDNNGVIWSVTYPQSGVVCFNPATGQLKDYGHVYQQNWAQYQRSVAADATGWLYFAVGNTASQIIAFDPTTGKGAPLVPENERAHGTAYVVCDLDGKVYGLAARGRHDWLELDHGRARKLGDYEPRPKPIIAGSQALFYRQFPSGKVLQTCDLVERRLVVADPRTKETKELRFDYTSEGADIMGVATAPDGAICGGTAFPMRFFSYDPKTDRWANRAAYGQWNAVATQGDRFFVGGYTAGFLLEWNPSRPWVATVKDKPGSNPLFLTECAPSIYRPHRLLPYPDGRRLLLAGTPDYGLTGGGLLIWDRKTRSGALLEHTQLLPEQSTISLAALPEGKALGGTTTSPGTGGEKKARQAELYILDLASRRIEWHQAIFPGAQEYTDLCPGPKGLVFGFVDRKRFFVFDSKQRKVLHQQETGATFGATTSQQSPRVFVLAPEGAIYILFTKAIARLDPDTFTINLLAPSPVPIGLGGDWLDGRIYFGNGSHLYSYKLLRRNEPP